MVLKYVDDFFGAQSKRSWTCANKFMKIIMAGFGLDLDAKKCKGFMDVIVILGADIMVISARLVVMQSLIRWQGGWQTLRGTSMTSG